MKLQRSLDLVTSRCQLMNELNNKQIRAEISKWMGELFDKDVLVDNVKKHVAVASNKVVETKLKGTAVTKDVLRGLFKDTEREF